MKRQILFLIISIFLFSCTTDDDNNKTATNPLEELNLLGTWEISSRSFDGITPLTVFCCEFITLDDNTDTTDLIGNLTYMGNGIESNRVFEVSTSESTITFTNNDGNQLVMNYIIQNNTLQLQYTEDDVVIEEDWIRQ